METKTTIAISTTLWKHLNNNRVLPKDTVEDVIWRFIRDEDTPNNDFKAPTIK